ncbi:hypothetical protein B0F90DRAFT_1771496 [Multifurca ochricompacta]|uniref:Uncharacterized protein n=1 Tax=Multifurca ochricompacta TaxID=376703 RepID=A0AAD4LWE1_9AGAM|nr:hypothetical protein B0F90DRAFT_1771496 [Multifurca ochricompacta]
MYIYIVSSSHLVRILQTLKCLSTYPKYLLPMNCMQMCASRPYFLRFESYSSSPAADDILASVSFVHAFQLMTHSKVVLCCAITRTSNVQVGFGWRVVNTTRISCCRPTSVQARLLHLQSSHQPVRIANGWLSVSASASAFPNLLFNFPSTGVTLSGLPFVVVAI